MSLTNLNTGRFWFVQLSAMVVLSLFVTLGSWQLGRGNVKSDIELAVEDNSAEFEQVNLPITNVENWRYKKIKLSGRYYADKQLLLDNQVRDGATGYNVVTPFFVEQYKMWVLVDRGWLAQGADRTKLPAIELDNLALTVSGRLYAPYGAAYSLGGIADGEDTGWPRRIQFVDYQQLSNRLGVTLQPFTLRLDAQQPFGYRRDWAAYNLSGKKHYGYAFQWYAMAFAVVVLWWLYSIRPLLKNK